MPEQPPVHLPSRPTSTTDETGRTQDVTVQAPRAPVLSVDPRVLAVGEAVIRWEKLRVVYNGVVGAWTLLQILILVAARPYPGVALFDVVIGGALVANLCYCLGPFAEAWLAYFAGSNKMITGILFGAGTLFTLLLATMALAAL